jgi:hypothetical protein
MWPKDPGTTRKNPETFSEVIDRAMAECSGKEGMIATDAFKHIFRAIAKRLDELHYRAIHGESSSRTFLDD